MTQPAPAYLLWFGPNALSFARALGRAGVPVVGCHHDPNESSVDTRYARMEILPPLERDEQAWLDFLLAEGKAFAPRRAALIPCSDAHWLFAARHFRTLHEHYEIAAQCCDNPEQWLSKPFQYAAAARAGVACPATREITSANEVDVLAPQLEYPCLVKPVLSHLWQRAYRHQSKLAFARSEEELRCLAADALGRGLSVMVQEYIPAPDHEIYGVFLCVDRHSSPLGYCVARKQRQHEPRFGNSCMSVCVNEMRPVELALRLVKELRYRGVGSAEFKRDPRDGEFKLMELNVRPTTLMGLAADSGVNLPLLLYRDLLGLTEQTTTGPCPVMPTRFGRRVGNFPQDLHAARFYRRREGLSYVEWAWSWLFTRDVYFAWDDMRPFSGHMHEFIDHIRRGKYRGQPSNFPTAVQWEAGRWTGRQQARQS